MSSQTFSEMCEEAAERLYLEHHGIKGQEWGVRNGPPYPLDAGERKKVHKQQKELNKRVAKGERDDSFRKKRTIPAGTIMYRTTAGTDDNTSGMTYVSYLESDRNHYKGGWIRQTAKSDKAYEHEYQLKKDLVIPSRDEVAEVINELVNKDEKTIYQTVDTHLKMMMENMPDVKYYLTVDELTGKYSEKKYRESVEKSIQAYKNMTPNELYFYAAQTLGLNQELKNSVVKELSKRGYNAMTDEASVGGQNGWAREGSDPLIIFEGASSLYKSSTKEISRKDEQKALGNYQKWQRKANRNSGKWSDSSSSIVTGGE